MKKLKNEKPKVKRSFNNIAKVVRANRLKRPDHYSQDMLSYDLGYKNGQFVSNIERGLCCVPFKTIRKLSELLVIDVEIINDAILLDTKETLEAFTNVEG